MKFPIHHTLNAFAHPRRGWIKVELHETDEPRKTEGGLLLPESGDEDAIGLPLVTGTVVALGPAPLQPGTTDEVPHDFNEGDCVALTLKGAQAALGGVAVKEFPGDELPVILLPHVDIWCVLTDEL